MKEKNESNSGRLEKICCLGISAVALVTAFGMFISMYESEIRSLLFTKSKNKNGASVKEPSSITETVDDNKCQCNEYEVQVQNVSKDVFADPNSDIQLTNRATKILNELTEKNYNHGLTIEEIKEMLIYFNAGKVEYIKINNELVRTDSLPEDQLRLEFEKQLRRYIDVVHQIMIDVTKEPANQYYNNKWTGNRPNFDFSQFLIDNSDGQELTSGLYFEVDDVLTASKEEVKTEAIDIIEYVVKTEQMPIYYNTKISMENLLLKTHRAFFATYNRAALDMVNMMNKKFKYLYTEEYRKYCESITAAQLINNLNERCLYDTWIYGGVEELIAASRIKSTQSTQNFCDCQSVEEHNNCQFEEPEDCQTLKRYK